MCCLNGTIHTRIRQNLTALAMLVMRLAVEDPALSCSFGHRSLYLSFVLAALSTLDRGLSSFEANFRVWCVDVYQYQLLIVVGAVERLRLLSFGRLINAKIFKIGVLDVHADLRSRF